AYSNIIIESAYEDEKFKCTANLIDNVFNNKSTANKSITATSLRKLVFDQYIKLLELLQIYYSDTSTDQEKDLSIDRIKLLLRADRPYSAFISWCVLEDENLRPQLEEFIGIAI
ncbi:hypothetical protein BZG72_15430, partial [Salinivibrio sp. PR6]